MSDNFQTNKILDLISERIRIIEEDIKQLSNKIDQKWEKEVRQRFHAFYSPPDGCIYKINETINNIDDRLRLIEQLNKNHKKTKTFILTSIIAFVVGIVSVVVDRLWK